MNLVLLIKRIAAMDFQQSTAKRNPVIVFKKLLLVFFINLLTDPILLDSYIPSLGVNPPPFTCLSNVS